MESYFPRHVDPSPVMESEQFSVGPHVPQVAASPRPDRGLGPAVRKRQRQTHLSYAAGEGSPIYSHSFQHSRRIATRAFAVVVARFWEQASIAGRVCLHLFAGRTGYFRPSHRAVYRYPTGAGQIGRHHGPAESSGDRRGYEGCDAIFEERG